MPEAHPSRASLEAFAFGKLSAEESKVIVQHLIAECEVCHERTGDLWRQLKVGLRGTGRASDEASSFESSPYRGAVDRAVAEASKQRDRLLDERFAATALGDELLKHPQPRRLTLVRNSKRFQTWGLAEYLLEESFSCRFDRPDYGVDLAEIGVAISERLDEAIYGRLEVTDQIGRACAYLGNALRVQSNLGAAAEAFARSKQAFAEGRADELDHALWLRFHSHLLTTRSQFDTARGQQDQAIAIYRRNGELDRAARLRSDQAVGILYSGDPECALPRFEQALELFMAQGDERRVAMAHHNIASCLLELERYDEAIDQLQVSTPVLRRLGDSLSLLRARWLEAKIELGREDFETAERLLVEVRDGFIDREITYDAALASLELAMIFAAQGRAPELRELVGAMVPIFRSQELHREALAALIVFRRAVEEDSLTLARVRTILEFLHEARSRPDLKFVE